MQPKRNVVIFFLFGAALAGLFYLIFDKLLQARAELVWTRLKIQQLETEVAHNLVQFSNSQVQIKVLEGSAGRMKYYEEQLAKLTQLTKNQDAAIKKSQDALATITIDHERLESFFSMTMIPAAIRIWYSYSQTQVARLDTLEGHHPDVVDYIRKYKIIPPTAYGTDLKAEDKSLRGTGPELLHIFKNKSDGFFIECGAFDGLYLSNTFYLERLLKWSGVLIEAEPYNFEQVVKRKRNAVSIGACLSLSTKSKMSGFTLKQHVLAKIDNTQNNSNIAQVHCFPLYSILLALNRTSVDFFSLDIEGNELDVLRTIPFDKVDIKVLLVEFSHIKEGRQPLDDFMLSKGYVIYGNGTAQGVWAGEDRFFIKKGSGLNEHQ